MNYVHWQFLQHLDPLHLQHLDLLHLQHLNLLDVRHLDPLYVQHLDPPYFQHLDPLNVQPMSLLLGPHYPASVRVVKDKAIARKDHHQKNSVRARRVVKDKAIARKDHQKNSARAPARVVVRREKVAVRVRKEQEKKVSRLLRIVTTLYHHRDMELLPMQKIVETFCQLLRLQRRMVDIHVFVVKMVYSFLVLKTTRK